jgi:hypothetical protein
VSGTPKPPLLYVLAGLLLLEALALAAATVYLVIEIFVAPTASLGSAVALAVLVAVATAGLGLVGISALSGKYWIRGAAICWQVIQLLVAWSILQAKSPDVAWALAIPAIVILILLFTKPVLAATARPK